MFILLSGYSAYSLHQGYSSCYKVDSFERSNPKSCRSLSSKRVTSLKAGINPLRSWKKCLDCLHQRMPIERPRINAWDPWLLQLSLGVFLYSRKRLDNDGGSLLSSDQTLIEKGWPDVGFCKSLHFGWDMQNWCQCNGDSMPISLSWTNYFGQSKGVWSFQIRESSGAIASDSSFLGVRREFFF